MRIFKRFSEIRAGDTWYIGRDRWDAIIYQTTKNIRVYGIGIYEPLANPAQP